MDRKRRPTKWRRRAERSRAGPARSCARGAQRRAKSRAMVPRHRAAAAGAHAAAAAARRRRRACRAHRRRGCHVCPRCRGERLGGASAAMVQRCVRGNHRFRPVRLVSVSVRLSPPRSRGGDIAGFVAGFAGRAHRARRALRVSVPGDRRARPVRHHRQAADRAGAALCRRPRRSVRLYAVRLAARMGLDAVGPRHHRGVGRDRDRRDLAAKRAWRCGSMRCSSC